MRRSDIVVCRKSQSMKCSASSKHGKKELCQVDQCECVPVIRMDDIGWHGLLQYFFGALALNELEKGIDHAS